MTLPMYFDGYMIFLADAPFAGLDPHPSLSPATGTNTGKPRCAEDWASFYNVQPTYLQAIADSLDFYDTDYEDLPDIVLRVRVDDKGILSVYDNCSDSPMMLFDHHQICAAFGVERHFTS
jgi:hypothetical protein